MNAVRLALALGLLAAPAAAFDITAMSDAEREAFRAEIRAYLLDNPEVMLDVQTELDARQQAAQTEADKEMIAANADRLLNDADSYAGGNLDGTLTVVEFIDYKCGYCKKAHAEVAELVKSDGNIRYVVKEYPILGEQSLLASRFAVATLRVAGPEAYEKVKDGFYESFRGDVTPETLASFATGLGLDAPAIMAAMEDPAVLDIIKANHALAQAMQISGTPTFVMGDTMLRGYVPLDVMRSMVAEVRG
jgi:protein-disulfide isomerase